MLTERGIQVPIRFLKGTGQRPKHHTGDAEHAQSPSKGTLALVHFLRESILREMQNMLGVPQGGPWPLSTSYEKASYGICRTCPESLKRDPGTCQLPKGKYPIGYAEHAWSLSRGTLILLNFLKEIHDRDTGWLLKQFTSQYAN
ncbi:hypothetical protein L3X38_015818 [Prunus dulcis]|uniref:Uncharacterized protein n=1 Tax=Prunus dulcis TaxID=3755 RepID=A0AAD4Z878_PRUDU|nr:hypothetical protein L3X38_015818 [Prunus dulcis]